jgi:hypothetical protein
MNGKQHQPNPTLSVHLQGLPQARTREKSVATISGRLLAAPTSPPPLPYQSSHTCPLVPQRCRQRVRTKSGIWLSGRILFSGMRGMINSQPIPTRGTSPVATNNGLIIRCDRFTRSQGVQESVVWIEVRFARSAVINPAFEQSWPTVTPTCASPHRSRPKQIKTKGCGAKVCLRSSRTVPPFSHARRLL